FSFVASNLRPPLSTLLPYTTLFRSRLSLVTLCLIHHCHLLDRCPGCDAPVTFQHLPGEVETLTRCARCQGDIRLAEAPHVEQTPDRKSTRLNSSHGSISYAVFCLKK